VKVGRLLPACVAALCLSAAAAGASAPETSVRPEPRPTSEPAPVLREVLSTSGVRRSPRPEARPENLSQERVTRAAAVRSQPLPGLTSREGAICGARDIEGVRLSPVAGRVQGCGIAEPVRVTSVAGVALSQAATMDCPTALALREWVTEGVVPTVGNRGGGVARLNVAGHYVCRTRNNQKGAPISEHGRGRAIDISGLVLKNGTVISVLKHWRDASAGPILKDLHRAACGTFGTVLGPNSDRFHRDHFHFDTARHRNGSFCR
jgi:hypothetical protein